ncbi:MAG: 3-hydroxyacyl-CoA dehydrogenase family protein, partial [Actinomycetota bacterium]
VVRSRSQATAEATRNQIQASLQKQVVKGKLTQALQDEAMKHICVASELSELKNCDLIIESAVEDLATKKDLFEKLDAIVNPECIIATNTSTLPVIELARSTKRPDRVCGIHFFNPATIMPLVEVVRPITASDETIALANEFVKTCGKEAVQVVDRAGFIVNALLFPYLNNAIAMFEAGTASIQDIDTAMKGGCNFPMGPFALLDLVGLDTSVAILEALHAEFKRPELEPRPMLRKLVSEGKLGRKTKQGFFNY